MSTYSVQVREERRELAMGQLIKLQDYVSRYEQNIFHYPSRFVLLKKQQWEKLRNLWENPNEMTFFTQTTKQNGNWKKMKNILILRKLNLYSQEGKKQSMSQL